MSLTESEDHVVIHWIEYRREMTERPRDRCVRSAQPGRNEENEHLHFRDLPGRDLIQNAYEQ